MSNRYLILLLLFLWFLPAANCSPIVISINGDTVKNLQVNSSLKKDSLNWKRFTPVILGEATFYTASMTSLYQLWYKNYPHSNFHFFNDINEYMQMDKFGHMMTSYYLSKLEYSTLRWTGLNEEKSTLYGGGMGIFYLTVIEVFDGFSSEWGFSPGDMTANTLGAGLFVGQQLGWKEQRIQMKWSYHQTIFAKYRPDQFGKNLNEEWLKDYNGQTYWFSVNIKSFLHKENKFPAWLNLAVGYGADGMTGGTSNILSNNGITIPPYKRYRQFYLSGDIDISRIKTHSKTLHFILNTLSFIKIPFPTIEFSNGKIIGRPLYF